MVDRRRTPECCLSGGAIHICADLWGITQDSSLSMDAIETFAGLGKQHQAVLKELVRALERISTNAALKWALQITNKV